MFCSRFLVALFAALATSLSFANVASAQRLYSGSTPSDAQYSGASSLDSNGRAANADGRAVDRYGLVVDDYGRSAAIYRGTRYAPGATYYPGGYNGLSYSNGIGYSVGVGQYSGGYYSNAGRFGTNVATGTTSIAAPRTIVVGGVYNARTVMNNSTRGGVVEYTNNGNGYVYSPGSSYQSVLSTGPSIFPSIAVVQPTQPAALIETRPTQSVAKTFGGNPSSRSANARPLNPDGNITLVFPNESSIPLTYVLNGTTYTIKPGYTQTFLDDRIWTIEFFRGGSGSQPMKYDLKAGTYRFFADENGWDLKQVGGGAAPDLPPSPSPISSLPPALAPPSLGMPALNSKPVPVAAPVPSPDF